MKLVRIQIRKVRGEARLPGYATDGASGMDLRACLEAPVLISPGQRALIPTGISLAIPQGFEGQVRPRSGLALRHGLTILNTPGTIDSDYRGEIKVLLVNLGSEVAEIAPEDRVAQLVVAPVVRAEWVERERLPPSGRGVGGFGHTGRR